GGRRWGGRGGAGKRKESGGAVAAGEGMKADAAQQLDEDLARRLVIVDHQHLVGSLHRRLPSPRIDRALFDISRSFFPAAPAPSLLRRAVEQALCQGENRASYVRRHRERSALFTARCASTSTA